MVMLRITTNQTGNSTTLKVEGRLLAAWADEVRLACSSVKAHGQVYLDLSQVSFVDQAGFELLTELTQQGIQIAGRSNYVAELLKENEI
jgi:anti-anti-sigma regulatory factor